MTGLFAMLLAAAPLADVWPYQVKRLPDGALDYTYDLTPVKAAGGTADARAAHSEEDLASFLRRLPKETHVRVSPGGGVALQAGRPIEPNPMSTSFAQVSDGPMSADDPLGRKAGARLRAPLHPETPKLLVGAETVLWSVRSLEDGALAAVELDTEWLRHELWARVLEKSIARFHSGHGDGREGALALAARIVAANACLDKGRLSQVLKGESEVVTAAEAEIARLSADPDAMAVPPVWTRTPELTCAAIRVRAMGQSFPESRAGTAAVLTFLDLLESDAKTRGFWERARQRRDRFVGLPVSEPVLAWKQRATNPPENIESLSDFIEGLPLELRTPPALIALPSTPFHKFSAELSGPERGAAVEELITAIQDGRVSPATTDVGWPTLRDATLASLVVEAPKTLSIDSGWRDRLASAFAVLQGASHDARGKGSEPSADSQERSELKVRLMAPPMLELEPMPQVFERAAASLESLAATLTTENLTGLKAVGLDGKRGETIIPEARRWVVILKGLAKLAVVDAAPPAAKDVAEARRFIASWRSEAGLTRDVRTAAASEWAMGGERMHAAVVGVARRELAVGFLTPPNAEVVGLASPFSVSTEAEQRYIVPVLVTVGVPAPAAARVLDRAAVKTAIDGVAKDPSKAEAAFSEALHGAVLLHE